MKNDLQNLVQEETISYKKLCSETGYQSPPWILPAPSCDLLKKICALFATPPCAFEFGSGRSTIALRSVCAGVTSVEDSAEWLEKTEQLVGQIPKRPSDLTAVVPLTRCRMGLVPFKSFNLDSHPELVDRLRTAQVVLVDSPPNPATREHALYLALCHVAAGAIVILDDLEVGATLRFAQRSARDNAHCLDFVYAPIDHGLGLFLKTTEAKISYQPSLREILGAWKRS